MPVFGVCFLLYFVKLCAGNGFSYFTSNIVKYSFQSFLQQSEPSNINE